MSSLKMGVNMADWVLILIQFAEFLLLFSRTVIEGGIEFAQKRSGAVLISPHFAHYLALSDRC